MRLLIQRVTMAKVEVNKEVIAAVQTGVCVFVAAGREDQQADADYLAEKIAHLRIFDDAAGKMNLSLADIKGEALIVSEFTLYGDCRQGRRPSFSHALAPVEAEKLCEYFIDKVRSLGIKVQTGKFRSAMRISLVNDGPVTFILDSGH